MEDAERGPCLAVRLTQTIKTAQARIQNFSELQNIYAFDKKQNGKVEQKVWKGKSNKEQSRSLHVTKCTSLGSMIYFLVRQNKKSSPMVLSGVRELNLVMSIWPFGPLQGSILMCWEWCVVTSNSRKNTCKGCYVTTLLSRLNLVTRL